MGASHDPDTELMLRVKRGDMEAFAVLVEKYKQPVMNLVYLALPDPTEAEDLAQNVFVQVHKSAHRYKPSAKFSTWLFTIARNLCLNEIRRRARHPAESLDQQDATGDGDAARQVADIRHRDPGDLLLKSELESKVEEAIRALPAKQRIALLLCREEELSYEEIARVLGRSVSATKSLIHRARETLKARLKPYLSHGSWSENE
ncbi:MAG TPA: sigma-70 family RNA polymerase sigma factor [Verrucomicrobiota bacterium]|nr:sigma-70 family RNA polymerase sigma factor [Verrucomicrobiota bacterium]HOK77198.1 sigma-70 family RNA polymerase sigma factor [Verrucomicrobiota bacterium]